MGELQVRGPTSAVMYWNNREQSRATFLGEWTRSGDKYIQDDDGYYVYCGRRDDMLKVGGIYVSPFEVEGALQSHPDVLEAAVVAWPDEDQLIKPKAFVVLKSADAACDALGASRCRSTASRSLRPTNIRAGSSSVPTCRRPRPEKSSASGCGRKSRAVDLPWNKLVQSNTLLSRVAVRASEGGGAQARMMRQNLLGRTGLLVSELAFGAGVTGGIMIKGDETTQGAGAGARGRASASTGSTPRHSTATAPPRRRSAGTSARCARSRMSPPRSASSATR